MLFPTHLNQFRNMVAIQEVSDASVYIVRNFNILCEEKEEGKTTQSFRQLNRNLSNRNYLRHNFKTPTLACH